MILIHHAVFAILLLSNTILANGSMEDPSQQAVLRSCIAGQQPLDSTRCNDLATLGHCQPGTSSKLFATDSAKEVKLYETILQTYPRLNEKCSPWTATEKLGAKDSLLGFDVWKFPPLSSQVIGDKIGELVCTLTLVEFERAKETQRNQTRLKTWWISFRIWIVISTISLRLFEEAKYGNIVKNGRMCCSIQHNLNLMIHLVIILYVQIHTLANVCASAT